MKTTWWAVVAMVFVCGCSQPEIERPDSGQPDASGVDASVPPDASVDAGSDAGSEDAGTDAGEDAGLDASVDSITLTLSADAQKIRLSWNAGALQATSWIVFRDGMQLATLSGSTREFDDTTCAPGSLNGFDASATRAMPQGIELEWNVPSSSAGPEFTYSVRAQLASGDLDSNMATGRRTAPALTGFTVTRADGGWSFTPTETVYLDTAPPSPTVNFTALAASAEPRDQNSSVVLRVSESMTRTITDVNYTVRAEASAGISAEVMVTGDRGGNRVEYQWQRSLDDSPTTFVDLPYVKGKLWLDPDAVLGEGRYYRVAARSQCAPSCIARSSFEAISPATT